MNILKKLPLPKIFIGFICGIVASLFWGYHAVLIRYLVLQGVPATVIAHLRPLIGSLFLHILLFGVLVFKRKKIWNMDLKNRWFWIAVFSLAISNFLFHQGLKFTLASDAILLEAFSPIVVLMLFLYFLPKRLKYLIQNPKMISRFITIVLMGTVGASFILLNDPQNILVAREVKLKGDIIEFVSMILFAVFMFSNYEYQRRTQAEALPTTALILFFSGILLAPFVPWQMIPGITNTQWYWILLLGIVSTGLAYVLWQIAARSVEAVPLALLFFSVASVFNVGIESLIFQLSISIKFLFGGILIIFSAISTQYLLHKEQQKEKEVDIV